MILLVTCYFQENYGSMLQAYATQAFLDKLGIENRTVNFDGLKKYMNKVKIRYYIKNIRKTDAFAAQLRRSCFKFTAGLHGGLMHNTRLRKNAMRCFSESSFRLTAAYSFEKLSELCRDMNTSAVIVGSDQLWLPSNIYADYYTLNFVPHGIRKISYATSFGVSQLDADIRKRAERFLSGFDCISVREKSGAEIIEDIMGKKPPVVCDPTLLFNADEWRTMLGTRRLINEDYIFCYFFGDNPKHRRWAAELKRITGLKIAALTHLEAYRKCDASYADAELFDVGPAEFVSLIENASYICTDSFHGTVFSLLFHKKFFTFRRFGEKHSASTNSRLDSLLEPLSLADRIIEGDNISAENMICREIDYIETDRRLEGLRDFSGRWLKAAMGNS